jgi:hypothetical protein
MLKAWRTFKLLQRRRRKANRKREKNKRKKYLHQPNSIENILCFNDAVLTTSKETTILATMEFKFGR